MMPNKKSIYEFKITKKDINVEELVQYVITNGKKIIPN